MNNPFRKSVVRRAALAGAGLAATGALLVTALPALADGPHAARGCELEKLSTSNFDGPSMATSIATSGQLVGGYVSRPGEPTVPAIWDNGEFRILPSGDSIPIEDSTDGKVLGIDAAHLAVGSITIDGTVLPFRTNEFGRMELLKTLVRTGETADDGTVHGEALAIGTTRTAGYSQGPQGHPVPVMWQTLGSQPLKLELPDDAVGGKALTINVDGPAGYYTKEDGKKVAAMWDVDGAIVTQAEHPDADTQITSAGMDIQVGNVDDAAAIWRDGEDEPEVIPDSGSEVATNREGDITGSLNPDEPRPIVIPADGEQFEMPVPDDGFATPTAINHDATWMAGNSSTPDGIDYPVRWKCSS